MSESGDSQFNTTPLYIALALAILLVVGVLIGAKVVYTSAASQPVGMTTLDAPEAGSQECQDFLTALPKKVLGHKRAEIADPAPEGAAAYASNSVEQVTLRCGISLPLQYTEVSPLTEVDGMKWLQVVDATPGSTMQTWYSIDTFPAVAVTADAESIGRADNPVSDLDVAMGKLKQQHSTPHAIPLTELDAPQANNEQCLALRHSLPAELGEGYTRDTNAPADIAVWTKPGQEPIVIRCGVTDPEGYTPGAQLNQVDQVTWFQDTTLANGTTSGAYFALGRDIVVAMSMPTGAGNTAIVTLSKAIAANTKAKQA
ncbi:DUF3515 domain-containing protein [Corynebacterium sp. H128]|uniref:DUF3515 domain-containing protein n=1 Tax=unclassified Corynebacterium TaxID=2624378 RepID=UPI0030B75E7C